MSGSGEKSQVRSPASAGKGWPAKAWSFFVGHTSRGVRIVIGSVTAFAITSASLLAGLGFFGSAPTPPRATDRPHVVGGWSDLSPVWINGQPVFVDPDDGSLIKELLGETDSTTVGEGPLSGTWDMYWTNSQQSENVGLIFRFVGIDSGTVEVVNDETEQEFDTSFTLDGDYLTVEFTRLIGDREVPERSKWEGSFISSTELDGTWYREDWTCPAPPSECQIGPGFNSFPSRLVLAD